MTDKAVAVLLEVQAENDQGAGMTFRLVERRGGFGLAFDTLHSDDQVFTSEGRNILCLSPDLAERALDVTIDVQETSEGRRFTFLAGGG